MRIAPPLASFLLTGLLVGCGAGQPASSPEKAASSSAVSTAPAAPASSSPPTPEAPTYGLLTKAALEKALVELDQLPPGYSQDPPYQGEGNKTFCDYKPPTEERLRVRRDFTKGGGLSTEVMSFTLRQFASPVEAREAWDAMTKALKTCRSEIYDGSKLTYAPMSAPRLGEDSAGVKIEGDGVTVLQNFVLVGPVIVSSGGGGLVNADADAVARMLKAQVERYERAAMN